MLKTALTILLTISYGFFVCPELARAQAQTSQTTGSKGTKKQITIIVAAGLAGAVLGLSTLSFYGRPQDRLSNIAVGFALGIIAGTIFTTYKAAAKPKDFYQGSLSESEAWQNLAATKNLEIKAQKISAFQLNF